MTRTLVPFAFAFAVPGVACSSGSAGTVSSQQSDLGAAPDHVALMATQKNTVADQSGVAGMTDPDLVNAWGLAFAPSGIAWISANGSGLGIAYDDSGNIKFKVTVPPPNGGEPPSAPTGQAFNPNPADFMGDRFIFVTEDGTVSGWQPSDGSAAMLRADNSSSNAVYKGTAIATMDGTTRLYAADFHNAKIDVFDSAYQPVMGLDFTDRHLPAGFAPFNVAAVADHLLVTYALQDADAHDDVAGAGNGFVDVFDLDGQFDQRLISHGVLNSPWGIAVGRTGARDDRGDLFVGNFGDGRINVFQVVRVPFERRLFAFFRGAVGDTSRRPLVIDGLWSIKFGPGAGGFDRDQIYFTAGPDHESHGLFGELSFK